MRVLGLVPARGGSKGIPRKNVSLLCGEPLLAYTANAALAARRLSRIVLSTDDGAIAEVGRRCGLEVPFRRPEALSRDETPMLPVIEHAIHWMAAHGQEFDAVCLLQPTNPLRRPEDIDGAIALLERTDADSVISFVHVGEKQPARMKFIATDGRVIDPPFAEAFEGQPRQQLPDVYLREGSIYLTRVSVLLEQRSLKGRDCRAWFVPPERAWNIDTPLDLFIAEQLLARQMPWQQSPRQPPLRREPRAPEGLATGRPAILCAEGAGLTGSAARLLRRAFSLIEADLDRDGLRAAIPDADVLWVRLRHRIDAGILAAATRLRVIVSPTTGLNHIDLDEARRRGIRVLSLRGETEILPDVRATAEHTLALILALLRHLPAAAAHVRGGRWAREHFTGAELYGKTLGIVGYGRLGRIVARYARGLDASIVATDPSEQAFAPSDAIERVPLDELLRRADVVTLHVNLSGETRRFFGREQFAAMKQGAWFINTARGELIDEDALLDALQSGKLTGAALDVLSDEHADGMGEHPLVRYAQTHSNLLITPHIGGCTTESMEKTERAMAGRLLALLPGIAWQPRPDAVSAAE